MSERIEVKQDSPKPCLDWDVCSGGAARPPIEDGWVEPPELRA